MEKQKLAKLEAQKKQAEKNEELENEEFQCEEDLNKAQEVVKSAARQVKHQQ